MTEKRKPLNKALICSICQRPLSPSNCGNAFTILYGNNAEPVNSGRCCDECNDRVVIPARISMIQESERK